MDLIEFAALLKTLYTKDKIQNMVYKDSPWLATVNKKTDFTGDSLKVPLIYANSQNRSANVNTARSQSSNLKSKAFSVTRSRDYSFANIDNELILASKGNEGAFLEATKTSIDSAIGSIKRSLEIALFRNGSGSLGQRGSVSSAVLTLKNIEDVVNFEEGQVIVASATDGGGSVRANSVTLTKVDRDLGKLTANANWSTITSMADDDFLFAEGDYDSKIKGLDAWIPMVAPTSTPFFNVDRTSDVTRLGGVRFDGSALPIDQALQLGASRIAREGGAPDMCIMNFSNQSNLELALGSKVQYLELKVGEIGFQALKINGPRGTIKVVADMNCPDDRAYMLTTSTWRLHSLGECPMIMDLDGNKMLRAPTGDGQVVQIQYYAQLYCNAPGYNGVIKLK